MNRIISNPNFTIADLKDNSMDAVGSTLTYSATVNPEVLGMTEEEVKSNPILATERAAAYNLASMAIDSYDKDIANGVDYKQAFNKAKEQINTMTGAITSTDKVAKRNVISLLSSTDSEGNAYSKGLDGNKYFSNLTNGVDIGNSATQFLTKVTGNTLLPQLVTRLFVENGWDKVNYTNQSYKMAALMENYNHAVADDAMLSSAMEVVANIASYVAPIFEGVGVSTATGTAGLLALNVFKGAYNDYALTTGSSEQMTADKFITGIAFDTVTSAIGIGLGQVATEKLFGLEAMSANIFREALTKNSAREFAKYAFTPLLNVTANTMFDMATDYGLYTGANSLGVDFIESTDQRYNLQKIVDMEKQLALEEGREANVAGAVTKSLLHNFGMRLATSIGSNYASVAMSKIRGVSNNRFMSADWKDSNSALFDGMRADNPSLFRFADIVSDWTFKAYPGSLANINEDLLRFNGNSKDLVSFLKDSNEFNAKAFSYLFVTQELATNTLFRTLTGGVGSATSIGFMKGINYDIYKAFDAVLGRTNPANVKGLMTSTAMLADAEKLIIDTDSVDEIGKRLETWVASGTTDADKANRYHTATYFLKNYAIAGEGYTSTDKIKLENYLSKGAIETAKDKETIDLKERDGVTYLDTDLAKVYDEVKPNARIYVGNKDGFSKIKSTVDTLNEIKNLSVDLKIFDGLAEVKNDKDFFTFLLRQSGFSDNGDTTSIKSLVDDVAKIANQLMTDSKLMANSYDFTTQSKVSRLVRNAITTYIDFHAKQANFLSSQDNKNIKADVRAGKIMEHVIKYVDGMILFGARLDPISRANLSKSMNKAMSYVKKNQGMFLKPVQDYLGNKYGMDSKTVTDPLTIFAFADAVISNRLNAVSVISKLKGTARESFEDLTAYGLKEDYATYRDLNTYSTVPIIYKDNKFVTRINGEDVNLVDGHFDQYLTTVIESLAEASKFTTPQDVASTKLFRELISVAVRKYMDTLDGAQRIAVIGRDNGGAANLSGIKIKTYDESGGLLEIDFSDKVKDNYPALAESLFKLRGEMSYRDLGPDKTNLYKTSFVKELTDNTTYTLKNKVYNVSEGKDELNSIPGLRTHIRSLIAVHDNVSEIVEGALVYVRINQPNKYNIAMASNNIVLKHMIRDEYHARILENTLSVKVDSKNRVYFTNDKFFTNIGTVITSNDLTVVDIGFDSIKNESQAKMAKDNFTKAGFIQLVAGGSQGQKGLYVKLHTPYGADDDTKSETLLRALGNIAVNNITTVRQDTFTKAISTLQASNTAYTRDEVIQEICKSLKLSTVVNDAFIAGLKGSFEFNMAVAISKRSSIKGTNYSETIKNLKDEMIKVATETYKAKAPTVSNDAYNADNQARAYIENNLKPDYTNKAYGGNIADLETKLTDAIANINTRLSTISTNDKDAVALGLTKQYFEGVLSNIKSPTDAITKEVAGNIHAAFETMLSKFSLSDYNDVRAAIRNSINVEIGNEWETFKSTMRDNLLKDTDEMSSDTGIDAIKARLTQLANSTTLNDESKVKAKEFLDKFDDNDFVKDFKNIRASENLFDKVANATANPKDVDVTAFKTWMDLDKAQDVQLGKLISTMALNGLPVMKPSYDLLKRVNASLVKSSVTDGEINSVIDTITKNGDLELVVFDEGKNADLTVGAEEHDGTMYTTNKLARVLLPLFGAVDESSKVTSRLFGGLVKINIAIESGDKYRMRLSTENIKSVQTGTMEMLEALRHPYSDKNKIEIDTSDLMFTSDDKKAILYSVIKSLQLHQVIKQQPIETSYPTQNIINNFSRYMQSIDTNEIESNVNNKINEMNTKIANGEEVTPLEITNTVKSSAREQSLPGYYHTVAFTTEDAAMSRVASGDSILVGSLNNPEFSIVGNNEGHRFAAKASISSYSIAKEIIGLSTNNKYKSLISNNVVKYAKAIIEAGDRLDTAFGMGLYNKMVSPMLDALVEVGTFSKVDGNYYRVMNRSSNDGKLHFYPILINEVLSPTYKSAVLMNRKASRWELADYDGDTVVAMAIKKNGIMDMVREGLRHLTPSEAIPDNETAALAKYTTLLDKQDEMSNLMLDFSYKLKSFVESNPETAKMGGQEMALLFNVLEAANLSILTKTTIPDERMSPTVNPEDLNRAGTLVPLDKDKSMVAVLETLPFEFNFNAFDRFVVMTGKSTDFYANKVSSGFDVIDRQSIPDSSLGYAITKLADNSYQLMIYSNNTNKLGGTLVASVSADSMEAINQKIELAKTAGKGLDVSDTNIDSEMAKFRNKVSGQGFITQSDSDIRIGSVETIIKQFSDSFTNNPKTNFGKQLRQSLLNPAWSSNELGKTVMKILASASINTFSMRYTSNFVDMFVPYTLTPESYNLSVSGRDDLSQGYINKFAADNGLVIPSNYRSINPASVSQAKNEFYRRVEFVTKDIDSNLNIVKRIKKVFDGSSDPLSIEELKSLATELKKYNDRQTMLPYPMRVLSVLVNATTAANKEGSYEMMKGNEYVDNNLRTAFSQKFEVSELGNMYILSKEYVDFSTNLARITKALNLVKNTSGMVTSETLKYVSDGLNRTVSLNPHIKNQDELVNYITQFVKNDITVSSERGLGANRETVEKILRTLDVYVSVSPDTTVVRAPSITEGQFYGVPNDTEEIGRMFTLVDSEGKGVSSEALRNRMIDRMGTNSDVNVVTTSRAVYTGLIYSMANHSKTSTLLATQGLTTNGIRNIKDVLVDDNGQLKFISDVDKIKDTKINALMINQDNDLIVSSVLKSAKTDIVC